MVIHVFLRSPSLLAILWVNYLRFSSPFRLLTCFHTCLLDCISRSDLERIDWFFNLFLALHISLKSFVHHGQNLWRICLLGFGACFSKIREKIFVQFLTTTFISPYLLMLACQSMGGDRQRSLTNSAWSTFFICFVEIVLCCFLIFPRKYPTQKTKQWSLMQVLFIPEDTMLVLLVVAIWSIKVEAINQFMKTK